MLSQFRIQQIRQIAHTSFISPDGTMRLDPSEDRDPYPGETLRTSGNDNSGLFRIYYSWLLYLQGAFDERESADVWAMANLLRHPNSSGYFDRNPGRTSDDEKLDDYVGIASVTALTGDPTFARSICDAGDTNGYNFVTSAPGEYKFSDWRQGTDIAYYQFLSKRMPQIVNLVWISFGFVFQAFQGNYNNKSETGYTSEHLLAWVRYHALRKFYDDNSSEAFKPWRTALSFVLVFAEFYVMMMQYRTDGFGFEYIFNLYFRDIKHPCRLLSEGIRR